MSKHPTSPRAMELTAEQLRKFVVRIDRLTEEQRDRMLQVLFCHAWPSKSSQDN
jgi:uncharacterized protein (UPF0335 family)